MARPDLDLASHACALGLKERQLTVSVIGLEPYISRAGGDIAGSDVDTLNALAGQQIY